MVGGAASVELPDVSEDGDGRRLRRSRNRDVVVQCLLELFREGNLDPSTDEIAARSGVSARSLFRYFEDVSDLAHAAITRQQLEVVPLLNIAATPHDPTPAKVAALVHQRRVMFEAIGLVGVAARVRAPFLPAVAERLSDGLDLLRRQVATLFAPELAANGDAGSAVLTAVDLLTTYESWRLLRHERGLDPDQAEAQLAAAVGRLFAT